ncbi:hypothetical protein [Serratia aquatilis]|uniref:DUF1240 domain-containing protein n=1 Tax=Serratia aquatilis TaxID=1737515 RepID=A0ABV6E7E8_9GAMM
MYNLKHRFLAFLGFVFFTFLSLIISFFAFESLFGYLHKMPVFVFSAWSFFAALSPLVVMPFLLMVVPVIIYGRKVSIKLGKQLMVFSFLSLVLIVVLMILFSTLYKEHLNNQGYTRCQGVPMGWTPGMATKYAIDASKCSD